MAKFNTGSATIDKFLQIKKADESFYKYVGEETFTSLIKSAYPADLPRLSSAVEELRENGHNMLAYRIRREDGKYRWILAELEYEPIEFGGEPLISINIQDIQALEREVNAIKSVNSEYGEFFGLLDEFLFVYNIDDDDLKVFMGGNRQTVNLVHSPLDEWIQDVEENHYISEEYKTLFENLCKDLRNGTRSFKYELLSSEFSVNKEMEMHLIKGKTIRNSSRERKVIGCISVISQETKKKEINYNLESNKDAGMDVLNKKAITDYVKKAIAGNPEYSIHICIVDLDNFKNINDTFGHMFGDEVLVTVAEILKDAVGRRGVVGRIGGDEMMVVLEKVETHSELRGILRTIRSNIEWAYKGKKEGMNLSCSMGIASYPMHGKKYEDLFMIADKMLYRAKKKGKNRYIIYTPEIHGDAMSDDVENDEVKIAALKINKEGLIIRLTDLFLHKQIMTYDTALSEIGQTFELEEINVFYDNIERLTMAWKDNSERTEITNRGESSDKEEKSIQFVHKDNFQKLFNENGLAVIDHLSNIEGVYPAAFEYMSARNVTAAIIYKMNNEKKEGYAAFYKKSSSARKWAENDKAYINFTGKIIELALDDR